MKSILSRLIGVATCIILVASMQTVRAQAPQKMSYQAVVRTSANELVTSKPVGMRISILKDAATGSAVYVETQTPTTNANGLVSLEIGGGTLVSGGMGNINWAAGTYFIKTETDPTGGSNYTISGTSQLLSVPYALFAASGNPGPVGPQGAAGPAGMLTPGSIAGNTPFWNGTSWITNNSNIFNNGGNVGIGTSSPAAKLDVAGIVKINDGSQGAGKVLTSDANGVASWQPVSVSGGSGWGLAGSAGTIAGTNFIGTTDAQGFDIRTNNLLRTRITTKGQIETYNTGQSVFIGEGAGAADDLTNNQNVFIGFGAGATNATGTGNTAIGKEALPSNTTGNDNTAIGADVLFSNTTGFSNTASGKSALRLNTTGGFNSAMGREALSANTTGSSNTAIGAFALFSNTTGSSNTASGREALRSNTTGINNTANGMFALSNNTTGLNNTATGRDALSANTVGGSNTANGVGALAANTTGSSNTANGVSALLANTTGGSNTANGLDALRSNTTGSNNTANGASALLANGTGSANTATGVNALSANTTGFSNTANGVGALNFNTTGGSNTANGRDALIMNITGSQNTAIGASTLNSNTTGNQNTALGSNSFTTGTAFSNSTAIGYNAQVTASNMIRLGNTAITLASVQVAWTVTSDKRWKSGITESNLGLDFISKLKPVSYLRINDENKKHEYGFIAQELEEALLESGVSNSGIISQDDKGMLSVRYNDLMAPMVKAMQEQQEQIEKLKAEVALLKTQQQSVTSKLETENQLLKSAFDNRLKKIEEMLNAKAQK